MNDNFILNGSEYIAGLIEAAVNDGSRTATVSGRYIIDSAVRIPSDFTLVLENCYLRLADGCYSNVFVNESHETDIGRTTEGTDRNITIIGKGEAILDGGEYNGLSEKNWRQEGMPPIWKNNLILFTNVDGFSISGISCRNQRWWALNFIFCCNGYLGNIDFCASDIGIDPDGNVYHGLKKAKYDEVLVKNADGIDIRVGCHDIVIENITGFTEDDTVALTALCGSIGKAFSVDGASMDICNVTIRNIRAASYCTLVRLLNQGDVKLHDVIVDGVQDMSAESPYMDKGKFAVRVGDHLRMYGTRHSTKDETYNITIKNVYGRGDAVLSLAGDMDNVVIDGLTGEDGCPLMLDFRPKE